MSRLEWDKCVQYAIAGSAIAVAAFSGFCTQAQRPGGAMSWESLTLLGASVFFLLTGVLFSGLALGRHPGTQHWRWKVLLIIGLAGAVVLVCVRYYRNLTVFGQGVLLGGGTVILLEQLLRLGFSYYSRRKKKHQSTAKKVVNTQEESAAVPSPLPIPPTVVNERQTADPAARELERIRVVLQSLSSEALQELADLLGGPKSVHGLDIGMMKLRHCNLVEELGPGSEFGHLVFALRPTYKDAVVEFFRAKGNKS